MEMLGPLLVGADRAVAEWVRRRVRWVASVEDFGPMTAVGVVRHDRIIAGVVYHRLVRPDIHVTCAADSRHWGSPEIFREICAYPFDRLGCQRITCIVEASNSATLRFLEGFGFAREGRHPFAFPDGSPAVTLGLYRETCRWIKERPDGQVVHPRAA